MMWQFSALLSLVALGLGQDTETWSVGNCQTSKQFLKGFPVFIWDAASGKCQRTLTGHSKEVKQMAYSPDGKHLATGSKDAIQIWDTKTWMPVKNLTVASSEEFSTILYSPNSKQLAVSFLLENKQVRIRIFDASKWDSISLTTQHMVSASSLAYSPDGKQLASSDGDNVDYDKSKGGRVHIWDTATGQLLQTLQTQRAEVRSVTFSPDGRYVASGNVALDDETDKPFTIRIWDTKTWESLKAINVPMGSDGDPDYLHHLTYSPDGRHLAAGSKNNEIFVYDTESWKYVKAFAGKAFVGNVYDIAYSPDGKHLAYGGLDSDYNAYIRILDTATWSTLLSWKGPPPYDGMVFLDYIAFSPDGRSLATPIDFDDSGLATPIVVDNAFVV